MTPLFWLKFLILKIFFSPVQRLFSPFNPISSHYPSFFFPFRPTVAGAAQWYGNCIFSVQYNREEQTMRKNITIDTDFIQEEMCCWGVPTLALSVVREGMEPFTAAFGDIAEKGRTADAHTAFCIASCSKAMTSALAAMLVSEGKLNYDTPVVEYLPSFALADPEASENTTLRDILCHRTGLGGHDGIWPVPETLDQFTRRFRYLLPSAPFRKKAQYSNIMYALAGRLCEQVTGKDWSALMHEYIFSPLKMDESSCTADRLTRSGNWAVPHQVIEGRLTSLSVWNTDTVAPAASVNSTAADMTRWLDFLVRKGETAEGKRLIEESVFEEMISKQIDFPDFISGDCLFPSDGYAFGWQTGAYKGRRIRKHTGKIEGYSSIHAFLPEEKLGVAIMMNLHSPTVSIMHAILYTVIDSLLGEKKENWSEKFRPKTPLTAADYDDCTVDIFRQRYPQAESLESSAKIPPSNFVGTYFAPGYGQLEIISEGNGLFLCFRQSKLPLQPYWGNLFRAEGFKADILTLHLPVTFIFDPQGKAVCAQVPFEPLTADISFRRV